MSILSRIIASLRRAFAPSSTSLPDSLPLRDWADLPSYHPRCD